MTAYNFFNRSGCFNCQSGFTLIEMLITVAIVATLASVTMPMAELVVQRNKEQEFQSGLKQIRAAIDAYKQAVDEGHIAKLAGESGYPRLLRDLVYGVEKMDDPKKGKIYFLRQIPRDPFARYSNIPAEQTWGKRSYESSPDSPREGVDVFDVFTLSDGIGINGIPYRDW
jgi:general secretion pathway protein G